MRTALTLDLDYFKKINDAYGHRTGDMLLQKISTLIQQQIRMGDIVARYGGEEFTIISPETDLKGAAVLAERIRTSIEQNEMQMDSTTIGVTISIGVATYLPDDHIPTKTELLDAADCALYTSKRNGKNKLSIAKLSL